jgi:hypothetical protein
VLDGVKAGALGEHPPREDALDLAGELDLVDLDEGRGVRRFCRRACVAHPRRHFEGAELHCLVDWDFEMRDASRHFVQGSEHGDIVLNLVGAGGRGAMHPGNQDDGEKSRARRPR